LSANTVARLKIIWAQEYKNWCHEGLAKDKCVYILADGVYSGLRNEETKLCALVIIGGKERRETYFQPLKTVSENPPKAGLKSCRA